jgi:uncharacterized membrane protein YbhN (UPF0104 family)
MNSDLEEPRKSMSRPTGRWWLASIGVVIGFAGLLFVGRIMVTHWNDVRNALQHADSAILLLAFGTGLAGMTQIGFGWGRAIQILGGRIQGGQTLHAYFVGQLGKYVPGGIWPVLGRSELVRRTGMPASLAYLSTVISLVATYSAAALTAMIAAPLGMRSYKVSVIVSLIVAGLFMLGLLTLLPRFRFAILRVVEDVRRESPAPASRSGRSLILLVVTHIPAWFTIALATLLVSAALGTPGDFWNIVFATTVAWIAGFLLLPVPGGIGIRESAFVAAATSLPVPIAATVAITARLLFVTVDATAALALYLFEAFREAGGPNDHKR